jgi:probable HAF family extracellular repeat protein
MLRLGLATALTVASVAVGAAFASSGGSGGWVVTDLLRQARQTYPAYAGISLVGMTSSDQVLWTAYQIGGDRNVRHVFRWQNGKITDLGALPAGMNTPAFNNNSQIAGTDFNPPLGIPGADFRFPPTHSFLWRSGKVTRLGTLGVGFGFVNDLNDRGQVAETGATSKSKRSPRIRALLWQNGKLVDLGTLGGKASFASAISQTGQVIGTSWLPNTKVVHGFLWQNGKMRDLGGTPGATYGPEVINDHGQIVGTWTKPKDEGIDRAFLWQDGKITDLGSPAGQLIDTMAINNHAQVIWTTQDAGSGTMHGYLWQNGKLTNLGTLNGMPIAVSAINDQSQIVGTNSPASTPYTKQHAFIWENGSITQLPGPAIKAYTMNIDQTGTQIVLGGPCCQKQLLLWTRHG